MLPAFRQRLLIGIGLIIGSWVWMHVATELGAADGSPGISLFDSSLGVPLAIVITVLAGLPAVGLGLVASSIGNPLSGIFVVAFSLLMLAASGGSIEGFLWRSNLPGRYGALIVETIFWSMAMVGLLFLTGLVRHTFRTWLARLTGTDPAHGTRNQLLHVDSHTLLAGLIAAGIGGLLSNLLIQSAISGQVLGSLVLAFAIGALMAQLIMPNASPLGILLAPTVVAIAGYAYVLFNGNISGTDDVLRAWYRSDLPGLALSLPIQYLSGGIVGATIGLGLAQSLDQTHTPTAET